jgi:hypothetical protein
MDKIRVEVAGPPMQLGIYRKKQVVRWRPRKSRRDWGKIRRGVIPEVYIASRQGKLKRGNREIRKSGGGDINNKGTALKGKKKVF